MSNIILGVKTLPEQSPTLELFLYLAVFVNAVNAALIREENRI